MRPSAVRVFATPGGVLLALLMAIVTVGCAVAGDRPAPDFTLEDQDGRPVRLADLRGQPVLLTFTYTQCPDTCPLYLTRIRQALAKDHTPSGAQVLMVTVDPERDTPAQLRQYATAWPSSWRFLSGNEARLRPVWRDYQVGVQKDVQHHQVGGAPTLAIRHTAKLLVIDAGGRVTAELVGESWSTADLESALARTAPRESIAETLTRSASSGLAALILACGEVFGGDPVAGAALVAVGLVPGIALPFLVLRLLWGGRGLRQPR